MVEQKIISIAKEYLKELSSAGIEITHAYIYGSHSKGNATDLSDIDMLLVSPLFDNDSDKYLPKIWLSKIRTKNRIEPFIVGEKRFLEDDVSPLLEIVRREGVEIAA